MKRRMWIAFALTGIWLLAFATLIFLHVCDAGEMSLNEWGDFLAGASAPLALLWLVIGYFQHGEELRLNTKALEAQQEELRRQVGETARLVDATRDEVRLFQERDKREAKPDLVHIGRVKEGLGLMYLDVQNRGGEVRDIRVEHEGEYKITFSPTKVWESNKMGVVRVVNEQHERLVYPIRFCINCTDLMGNQHNIDFDLKGGPNVAMVPRSRDPAADADAT